MGCYMCLMRIKEYVSVGELDSRIFFRSWPAGLELSLNSQHGPRSSNSTVPTGTLLLCPLMAKRGSTHTRT